MAETKSGWYSERCSVLSHGVETLSSTIATCSATNRSRILQERSTPVTLALDLALTPIHTFYLPSLAR
jgi:hypothetical protein